MYKVIATAPTTYQLNSVRQFGSPIISRMDGSHIFSKSFETKEQAKEYLQQRALLYYDTEEEINEAMESIEKYGSLRIDAATASIEEEYKECSACHGKGAGYFSCCSGEIVDEDVAMCPECYEHLGEEECEVCDGTGTIN